MTVQTYRYTAFVTDRDRSVIFTTDLEKWAPKDYELDAAERYIDNTPDAFDKFYEGASEIEKDDIRIGGRLWVLSAGDWIVVDEDW